MLLRPQTTFPPIQQASNRTSPPRHLLRCLCALWHCIPFDCFPPALGTAFWVRAVFCSKFPFSPASALLSPSSRRAFLFARATRSRGAPGRPVPPLRLPCGRRRDRVPVSMPRASSGRLRQHVLVVPLTRAPSDVVKVVPRVLSTAGPLSRMARPWWPRAQRIRAMPAWPSSQHGVRVLAIKSLFQARTAGSRPPALATAISGRNVHCAPMLVAAAARRSPTCSPLGARRVARGRGLWRVRCKCSTCTGARPPIVERATHAVFTLMGAPGNIGSGWPRPRGASIICAHCSFICAATPVLSTFFTFNACMLPRSRTPAVPTIRDHVVHRLPK